MEKKPAPAMSAHLAVVEEPRSERHKRHKLSDIVVSAVCAVRCGAESFPASADFGQRRDEGRKPLGELPGGIPAPDTFNRVLRLLDPLQFRACFLRWRQAGGEETQGEGVASDGKTLGRSCDNGPAKRAIPMVSAGAPEQGVVLGQRTGAAKANELTALPELLDLLALKGGRVTSDALGGQRARAPQLIAGQAAYVLAVKGTQPTLPPAVEHGLATGPEADAPRPAGAYYDQSERGQGRGAPRG